MISIEAYKNRIRARHRHRASRQDLLTLEGAFLDIEHLYRGQVRYSGVPVVLHSLRVADMLCRIGADIQTTIAGLLHDILEDTRVTESEIRLAYGPWFAEISVALKKTTSLNLTHQKILKAGRSDHRSLLIKFCDRLDNMREIVFLPDHKRRRISRESLGFYLPFATRLHLPDDMREELKQLATTFA